MASELCNGRQRYMLFLAVGVIQAAVLHPTILWREHAAVPTCAEAGLDLDYSQARDGSIRITNMGEPVRDLSVTVRADFSHVGEGRSIRHFAVAKLGTGSFCMIPVEAVSPMTEAAFKRVDVYVHCDRFAARDSHEPPDPGDAP